ncbi:hypothetical protein G7075_00040 [Phycicoccus sp. HDW14]|uniref:hypothetical protein n=1 Tax=Phycicoccus sp. HDW14 TaxID=2714941 RepID=UPI001409CF60|nr:hypothetical protein [Phycicoccus sp. HDW14]QIM19886.1 hypothetical protein G7075_00040 [Phycicoccus sp. HDW14]
MRLSALLEPDADYEERDLPLGCQTPTDSLVPESAFSHGEDAITLAEYCGYDLMDFQRQGLVEKLGANMVEQRDGTLIERWAAGETADVISRRNGKSFEIEILILAGLFMLGERKIMYTAHRDDTALEVFNNVVAAIQRTPKFWAELDEAGPRRANGQRAIKLRNGAVCYFRTRTMDSARGQGYNRLILDESQSLTEEHLAALMPLVTGAENAQINYAGSAGGMRATIQAKLWRSYKKKERGLCYRGWHLDPDEDFDDLDKIAAVNPRLGRGLSYEFVAKEFSRMSRQDFGRERGGASTYPREEGAGWLVPEKAWARAQDAESAIASGSTPRYVLEADPQLERGTIGVAGRRSDGAMHIEVIDHEPGVAWMLERSRQLVTDHGGELWVDPKGPCGFMLGDLAEAGVPVKLFDADDLKNAWTWFYTNANPRPLPPEPGEDVDPDAPRPVPAPGVRHRGGKLMTQALAAAELRKLLDRHTLRRTVSTEVNQGPIVAPMLAGYAVGKSERDVKEPPPSPVRATGAEGRRTPPQRRTRRTRDVDVATTGF